MSDNDLSSTKKEKEATTRTDVASTEEIPSEVFDSSTYNSMTDLKTSASMKESEVDKVLSDTEDKEPTQPEVVHTESTKNANISPTVAPTMEGRASALKKSKESQSESISRQLLDKQTIQINKKITQMLQPLQKPIKSIDKQSQLIKQLQSELKQLQKQLM